MICPKCHNKTTVNAKFCTKCGCNLAEEAGKAEKEKKSGKSVVVALAMFVVLAVVGVAGFLVYEGVIELPVFGERALDLADRAVEETTTSADEEENRAEETETQRTLPVDADTLFVEADALLSEGKEKITIDAEIINGMENIEDAVNQFVEKAEEAGDVDLAQERVADAYASYVSAVICYKDMLNAQALSGKIYSQILSEMKKAQDLKKALHEKGIHVDSSLEAEKEAFIADYTDRMIATFDEFTQREMWSRTEAWNLMADASEMFDASDLDNPLRLRYAYALSWWIQKQIETELNNGTITPKGAAIKIANSIEAMDYNPMMMEYYIDYMNVSGEDCAEVERAFLEICEHIYVTQGIWLDVIDIEHFWYFNDFGEYAVDDINGVTTENRQWIRERMKDVEFIKD